jgi:hypothetical protein
MIFMHVYGGVYQIKTDQENGSLYYTSGFKEESREELPSGTKEAYDKWWYETFESKFLGDDDE